MNFGVLKLDCLDLTHITWQEVNMGSACNNIHRVKIEEGVGSAIAMLKQPEKNGGLGADVSAHIVRPIVTIIVEQYGSCIVDEKDALLRLVMRMLPRETV